MYVYVCMDGPVREQQRHRSKIQGARHTIHTERHTQRRRQSVPHTIIHHSINLPPPAVAAVVEEQPVPPLLLQPKRRLPRPLDLPAQRRGDVPAFVLCMVHVRVERWCAAGARWSGRPYTLNVRIQHRGRLTSTNPAAHPCVPGCPNPPPAPDAPESSRFSTLSATPSTSSTPVVCVWIEQNGCGCESQSINSYIQTMAGDHVCTCDRTPKPKRIHAPASPSTSRRRSANRSEAASSQPVTRPPAASHLFVCGIRID